MKASFIITSFITEVSQIRGPGVWLGCKFTGNESVASQTEFVTQHATFSTHTEVYFCFSTKLDTRWFSTKLAHLVTITSLIYIIKNVSSAY